MGYKMNKTNKIFTEYVDKFSTIKIQAELEGNNARRTIAKFMLNSLYGRFGLKYEPFTHKFVSTSEAAQLSIEHQIIENVLIDEDREIEYIKYTNAPSDVLKEIDKDRYNKLLSDTNYDADYVVRAVTIAAMVTSQDAIVMNPFLNMADNPCYYTDTDSLFLKYQLEDKHVGTQLGKLSFKGIAKRAYFISPKLYCLVMDDDRVIIKSKGVDNRLLTEQDFKLLLAGNSVDVNTNKIYTSLKKGNGEFKNIKMKIKPELNNRISYNVNNNNFDTKASHIIDGIVQL